LSLKCHRPHSSLKGSGENGYFVCVACYQINLKEIQIPRGSKIDGLKEWLKESRNCRASSAIVGLAGILRETIEWEAGFVSPASLQICDYRSVHSLINSVTNHSIRHDVALFDRLLYHTKAVVPVKKPFRTQNQPRLRTG